MNRGPSAALSMIRDQRLQVTVSDRNTTIRLEFRTVCPETNRRDAGKPTPPCPDCGSRAAPSDAASLLPGQPRIHHAPSCPTYLAAIELLHDDLDWFDAHPGEKLRLRPLARCEYDEMATALGRRVPRSDRRRWAASITPCGTGVARSYARDQRVVAAQVALPDQTGAV